MSFYFLFLVAYTIQAKQVNLQTSATLALSLRNLIEAPFARCVLGTYEMSTCSKSML